MDVRVTTTIDIVKADDDEQRIVFGWGSVAVTKAGEAVIDSDGYTYSVTALERAAYRHVEEARATGVEHRGDAVGAMVESLMVTPEKLQALGLSADAMPLGWWVGYRVDEPTWQRVKSGELRSFSIQGVGRVA